ncbi:MAG: LSM domain-containing protein [Methanobacterium sp.]|jgi:small nuclear ribonucleoprotein (snRNP)-like protein
MKGKIIAARSEEKIETPLHRQLKQFQNKEVHVVQKDTETKEGQLLAIDNYLNIAIQTINGMEFVKGTKILYIQIKT